MRPDAAIVPPLQHRHIPGDHGDLAGKKPLPVEILGGFPRAAGRGEKEGAALPNEGSAVENAAVVSEQHFCGQFYQTAVFYIRIA